ncbi:LamB/YcsF family protein [Janibacter indicus]|uniref:LamB/YcsF family protein n=1 Tax=Janibacter indicus TaxID=857417 RepID=UPI003EC0BA88
MRSTTRRPPRGADCRSRRGRAAARRRPRRARAARSAWLRRADEAGIRCATKGFADRAYTPEGTLVPRGEDGAVLSGPSIVTQALERAKGSVSSLCVAAPLRSAAGTLGRPTGGATSRAHEISVVYDGADLAVVVEACNTSVEAVVERHARTTWEVTFPGLHLSRRRTLTSAEWSVTADVDRVGARLLGPTLERAVTDELPSEEVVRGSCDRAAQLVPGARVRLSRAGAPARRRAPR